MKKVVSAAGAPLRALRRILLRILGLLGRPFVRILALLGRPLGRLRGLGRKARVVLLAVAAVALVGAVVALRPAPNEDERVRETLDRFEQASRDKDYQALCDEILARELVDRIRAAGLPCEVALRTGLEDRREPELEVLVVEVNGDQALARVRGSAVGEVAATDTYRLVNEDDAWRIASSGGGAELAAGTP